MWIVKNLLRGTLRFPGLDVDIPPRTEFDLDGIGRKRAEESNQLLVAFEEGYLQNIFKDGQAGTAGTLDSEAFQDRLEQFKQEILSELRSTLPAGEATDVNMAALKAELGSMREAIAGDVKGMVDGIKLAQARLQQERRRVLGDHSLSEAELKARLAFLEEKEDELRKNFEQIGYKTEGDSDENDIMGKADLLSSI